MKISIAGLHVDTGDSIRNHIQEKMANLESYFSQVQDVDVTLRKDTFKHLAEVTVFASGITLRGVGEGENFYIAIDDVVHKLQRQLEKYKGRLAKHKNRRMNRDERFDALEKQVQALSVHTHHVKENALEDWPEDIFAEYMPKIEHKDVRNIQMLTVDEAVMQMDLLQLNFFIFQNPQTHALNVVYREPSGTIGWVEPHPAAKEDVEAGSARRYA